jgi:hypothetical protein
MCLNLLKLINPDIIITLLAITQKLTKYRTKPEGIYSPIFDPKTVGIETAKLIVQIDLISTR